MPKKMTTDTQEVLASYPLRIQAIKSKGMNVRFYVYIPLPLAAAMGVKGGEEVSWELIDRDELHLIRNEASPIIAKKSVKKTKK